MPPCPTLAFATLVRTGDHKGRPYYMTCEVA